MNTTVFLSNSPEETKRIAERLGAELKGGEIISLTGPLGAGKTIFVKGMARAFDIHEEEVESPTFTLINVYKGKKTLYHVDLYRIEKLDDFLEAEIWEAVDYNAVVVVEWGEKFKSLFAWSNIVVKISIQNEDVRRIEIERRG